jgi:hypothetical protein
VTDKSENARDQAVSGYPKIVFDQMPAKTEKYQRLKNQFQRVFPVFQKWNET